MTTGQPGEGQDQRRSRTPEGIRSGHRPAHRSVAAAARAVLAAAGRHNVTGRAAEAAFFAGLALFPSVLTLVAVLRVARPAFGGDAAQLVSADLARLLRIVLTTRGTVAADSADSLIQTTNRSLLGIGTVAALFLLARCMRSVQRALAVIAGVPARSARHEWAGAVLLAAAVLSIGSVLLAGFSLGPLLGHSQQVGDEHSGNVLNTIWVWTRWPLIAVILLCLAAVLLAQERRRGPLRWRAGLAGAGFIVVGWTVATGLLPLYVAFAGHISPALGSLGGGLILLTWLYMLFLSLLLGAEINAVRLWLPDSRTHIHGERRSPQP